MRRDLGVPARRGSRGAAGPARPPRWLAVGAEAAQAVRRAFPERERVRAAEEVHEALVRLLSARYRGILVSTDALADRPRAALRALLARARGARVVVLRPEEGGDRALHAAEALGVVVVDAAADALGAEKPESPLPRADDPGPTRRPLDPGRFASGCLSRMSRPTALARFVLRAFVEASGATRASVLLRETGREAMRLRFALGVPRALIGQVRCPVGSGIAGRAAASGRPLVGFGSGGGPRNYDGTAYAVLPLGGSARCEGVICLSGLPGDAIPDEATLEVWRTAARQASDALRAARRLKRAESLSARDRLTGLPNRRAFERALRRELGRATRGSDEITLAVALLDVDRFKALNDRYGHQAGDRILLQIARRLDTAFRETDLVARWGGEEFAVLLPGVPRGRPDEAAAALERARRAVGLVPMVLGAGLPPVRVTVSAGLALFPAAGTTGDTLLKAADRALYRAKEGGRDRVEVA